MYVRRLIYDMLHMYLESRPGRWPLVGHFLIHGERIKARLMDQYGAMAWPLLVQWSVDALAIPMLLARAEVSTVPITDPISGSLLPDTLAWIVGSCTPPAAPSWITCRDTFVTLNDNPRQAGKPEVSEPPAS
jgi:hypothetical protein